MFDNPFRRRVNFHKITSFHSQPCVCVCEYRATWHRTDKVKMNQIGSWRDAVRWWAHTVLVELHIAFYWIKRDLLMLPRAVGRWMEREMFRFAQKCVVHDVMLNILWFTMKLRGRADSSDTWRAMPTSISRVQPTPIKITPRWLRARPTKQTSTKSIFGTWKNYRPFAFSRYRDHRRGWLSTNLDSVCFSLPFSIATVHRRKKPREN